MFRAAYLVMVLAVVIVAVLNGDVTADELVQKVTSQTPETNVTFERHQFTVNRFRGKIFFDGSEAARPILETKRKEIRLIETFEGLTFASEREFVQWVNKLRGARTYTFDEVTRVTSDGSTVTRPLVFFDNEERSEVDAQWHAWLDKRQAEIDEANRVRSAQEQEAKRYQQLAHLQELQAQALAAQAAAAERSAESLAVISGATSLWEVELIPAEAADFCPGCSTGFSDVFYGSTSAGTAFFPYVGWNSSFGINPSYRNVRVLSMSWRTDAQARLQPTRR